MKDIKRFIDHLECPIIDGIIFPHNNIILVDMEVSWKKTYEYKIRTLTPTSIEKLETKGELYIANCAVLGECVDVINNIKVICGESFSHGSDGFIAVLNGETRFTNWIAYFTKSNPFRKVEVVSGQIIAESTLDCVWKFDIVNPVNILVTHL